MPDNERRLSHIQFRASTRCRGQMSRWCHATAVPPSQTRRPSYRVPRPHGPAHTPHISSLYLLSLSSACTLMLFSGPDFHLPLPSRCFLPPCYCFGCVLTTDHGRFLMLLSLWRPSRSTSTFTRRESASVQTPSVEIVVGSTCRWGT